MHETINLVRDGKPTLSIKIATADVHTHAVMSEDVAKWHEIVQAVRALLQGKRLFDLGPALGEEQS